jgi:hypothetical protein
MTIKQQELSKAELLNRLDRRSRSRYCRPFPESLFNDLQKDALIPALERSDNAGLSPTYFATWRHFRRALQLQRLRGIGITGRDALRVQLFIRGYGLKVSEVRGSLRSEFLRGLSELRPSLRSRYFQDAQRDPGPRHLAAVERQLGTIDPRLEHAGLKQPTKFYLDNIRVGFGAASRSGLVEMEGLLLTGLDDRPLPKLIDDALNSTDDEYISGRVALAWMQHTMFRPVLGRSFLDSKNWPTLVLVTILVCQHVNKTARGFTAASILDKIKPLAGFERLAKRLLTGMARSSEGRPRIAEHESGSEQEDRRNH